MIKGRNRDTAWFSVLDGEWPRTKRLPEEALHELSQSAGPTDLA